MELLTPGIGLIFWQVVVFLLLFLALMKFAWKPIIAGLHARENFIQKSLDEAEEARKKAAETQSKNEALIEEAQRERDQLIKQAQQIATQLQSKAKEDAQKIADKMLLDAKQAISSEEKAAMARLQQLVAELAISVNEKILREQLGKEASARSLIEKYVKELPSPN